MEEYLRLDEVCIINMGQSPDSGSYNENGDGLPFFQGNADFGVLYPVARIWCNTPTKVVDPNTLLISVRAPIGALNFSVEKSCIGRGLAGITAKDDIDLKYIYYCLKGKTGELNAKGTGSTFKAIAKNALGETKVRIVSHQEQIKIVQILDGVVSLIEARRKQLSELDILIKARFVEIFGDPSLNTKGYPIKMLPEIAEYWNGLTYKPEDVADEGTIVLRSSNIQNTQLDFADTVRVTCKISEKKFVHDNDILMCSRNGSARLVGKVALIQNIDEPMSFGAFMMIIRSAYYRYLVTYFQMPAFRAQITTGATTTINQITGRMLDDVKIPVPDMDAFSEFSEFCKQVDKSKFVVKKALDEAQTLFDSLMQEYFG